MSPSLKSPLNTIGKIILIVLLTAFLIQTGISLALNILKQNITGQIIRTIGYTLSLDNISFSFFKGLHLKGLAIFYDRQEEPSIAAKDTFLSIKILPLFLGRITVDVGVNESTLLLKKEEEGYNIQIISSDISKKISQNKFPLSNIINVNKIIMQVDTAKIIYADNSDSRQNLDILYKGVRIIFYKSGKLKFDSNIKFKYHIAKEKYIAGILKTAQIQQDIKCSLQGTLYGKDLSVDMLLLNISGDQIVGTGLIKDFTERNPYVDIDFVHSTVDLKNIAFLKNNLQAQGSIFVSLKFAGLLDNIKSSLSGQLNDCYFRYSLSPDEFLEFKNLNGELEYGNNQLKLDVAFLNVNNLPLNIKFKTAFLDEPDIYLGIYLSHDFFAPRNIPVDKLEANFEGRIKDTLTGKLEIKALYIKRGLNFELKVNLKEIEFDYTNPKEKYFKAEAVELVKTNVYLSQKLMLANLTSKVTSSKDKLEIKDINISSYDSVIRGKMNFDLNKSHLTLALSGKNLDVNKIMRDTNITDKLLSGKLDIKIVFDNRASDFLKGRCYIKEGVVDLDVLGNAVKFPSLKRTNVDIINTYFMFSKDLIKIRGIKLYNKDIMLNAFWDINEKLSGALNIKIASGLLNQSVSFRKLLNIADIKKPYIDFKFLIGGFLRGARVMWVKGEFKEKLEQGLPDWVKRSIQTNLNKAIDEVSAN